MHRHSTALPQTQLLYQPGCSGESMTWAHWQWQSTNSPGSSASTATIFYVFFSLLKPDHGPTNNDWIHSKSHILTSSLSYFLCRCVHLKWILMKPHQNRFHLSKSQPAIDVSNHLDLDRFRFFFPFCIFTYSPLPSWSSQPPSTLNPIEHHPPISTFQVIVSPSKLYILLISIKPWSNSYTRWFMRNCRIGLYVQQATSRSHKTQHRLDPIYVRHPHQVITSHHILVHSFPPNKLPKSPNQDRMNFYTSYLCLL